MKCSLEIRDTKGTFHAKMGTIHRLYIKKVKTYPSEYRVPSIPRRDKKTFLSDQSKEIEGNNRMGKTRDLRKIRDTKGTFHAKMGSIKDRNGMDLTEAEDIKKRWQEYTEKSLMTL